MKHVALFLLLSVGASLPVSCVGSRIRTFNWETDASLNKNSQDESTAVTLHVFQLTKAQPFVDADWDSLTTQPESTLGETLIDLQKSPTIVPGRTDAVNIELVDMDKVKFIGVVGMFNRKPEVGDWKICKKVSEIDGSTLFFKDSTITLK